MSRLTGRVAIVTGAGRGLGRSHALALAAEGASVLVNDLGVDRDGSETNETPAEEVVREIKDQGGNALASTHDVTDWDAAASMVTSAIDHFGHLDILVNNAGILRDRSLANMSEAEWDDVIRVHLKGHAAPTRHAAAYWRAKHKAGETVQASVINTTSVGGLFPKFGQTNYNAAKMGIAALTQTLAVEGAGYGLRANAIAPSAFTRLVPGSSFEPETADDDFDDMDPANVSPLVVWLATTGCPATGQVFQIFGRHLTVYQLTSIVHRLKQDGRWTPEQMDELLADKLVPLKTAEQALMDVLDKND